MIFLKRLSILGTLYFKLFCAFFRNMSSEDLSSSSSIITPTAMQQRSHRLSRQTHVHHHAEVHNGLDADEEEEDESDHIQPIVQRRKDQQTLTQSKLCPQCGIFDRKILCISTLCICILNIEKAKCWGPLEAASGLKVSMQILFCRGKTFVRTFLIKNCIQNSS